MITVIPFSEGITDNILEVINIKDTKYVSILSLKDRIVAVGNNTEFSKLYLFPIKNLHGDRAINVRISVEVMRLLIRSAGKFEVVPKKTARFLLIEDVISEESGEKFLNVSIVILNKHQLDYIQKNDSLESSVNQDRYDRFTIPPSIDYDIELRASWLRDYLSDKTEKSFLGSDSSFSSVVEVSKMFKAGICIRQGIAYTDSSKIGVEVYKEISYSGPPLLISHDCLNELYSFMRYTNDSELQLFRSKEYLIAAAKSGVMFIWKNLRFNLRPNLDDLRKAEAQLVSVYQTEYKDLAWFFKNILAHKADQIQFGIDFENNKLLFRDTNRGVYRVDADFTLIKGRPSVGEIGFNFRLLKSLFAMKVSYNKVRFFIYSKLMRMDFINSLVFDDEGDECDEVEYDGHGKMVMVLGMMN